MKKVKAKLTDKVLDYLKRTGKKQMTYGEIAKRFDSSGMAVGQACAAIGRQKQHRHLVKRVCSKAELKKSA